MSDLQAQRNFFVFIIESPSAVDLYHARSEGALLAQILSLQGIACVSRVVISREALTAALYIGLAEEMKERSGHIPIVHISAHGDVNGIQLSDKTVLSWNDLRKLLVPVNKALNGSLLLCMSSCEGFSACSMAMQNEGEPHAFVEVVGASGSPTWSDTTIAFATFYHLIARGKTVADAARAMCTASGHDGFGNIEGTFAQQIYLNQLKQFNAAQAQASLEEAAEQQIVPADAKNLERGG